MVTKGTFKTADQTYQSKYILSIKKHGNEYGVTFFDVTTLEIYIGQFIDDENMSALRTLVCQTRPVEIIHEREITNSEVIKMLKNSPAIPFFTPMPTQKCYSFVKTCTQIERYFGENVEDWPEPLRNFKQAEKDLAFNSFGMAIAFLVDALIDEQTLRPGTFKEYSPESNTTITNGLQYMVLDAQALQHLEVIESAQGKEEGSLFSYIDHCKTQFGKRQLKRWCMAPLLTVEKIEARLNAVEDLIQHQSATDLLRANLAKLPDLEKLLAKIYTYSIKHSVKAVYFEDVSLIKMKEFRQLLQVLKNVEHTIESLRNLWGQNLLKSERLIALITSRAETGNGLFPEGIKVAIAEFDQLIKWKKAAGSSTAEIPEPQVGIDENFDNANDQVNEIKAELDAYL